MNADLEGKRLALLSELVPGAAPLVVIDRRSDTPASQTRIRDVKTIGASWDGKSRSLPPSPTVAKSTRLRKPCAEASPGRIRGHQPNPLQPSDGTRHGSGTPHPSDDVFGSLRLSKRAR